VFSTRGGRQKTFTSPRGVFRGGQTAKEGFTEKGTGIGEGGASGKNVVSPHYIPGLEAINGSGGKGKNANRRGGHKAPFRWKRQL